MEKLACKNCGEEYEGNYCNNCGQRRIDRHGFYEIRDYIGDTFELKRGFLKTIIGLILHPATVVEDYIGGKTKSYQNPISFFLTVLALSIFLAVIDKRYFAKDVSEVPEVWIYMGYIIMIFVFAGILKLFFYKSNRV